MSSTVYSRDVYTRISRSGGRSYLQLVEGYRCEHGKVRQRLVANLMRLDQLKPGALDPLIRGLQHAAGHSPSATAPRALTFQSPNLSKHQNSPQHAPPDTCLRSIKSGSSSA